MSTRYSLPPDAQGADTARGVRALAALVLVVGVIALCLSVAFLPEVEAPVAAVTDTAAPVQQQPGPQGA